MSHIPAISPIRYRTAPETLPPVAVFDLDGTLVDTAPDLAASLNHCLDRAGLPPVALEDVRPHAGHGARAMIEHAFAQAGRPLAEAEMGRQIERFLRYYEAHIADLSRLFPGAVALLDRMEAAGFRLAVCTNKTQALSEGLLRAFGLAGRFSAICGADTFHRRKPDPVHLLGTIENAGGGVAGSVMIGDTRTDVDAAFAAGIPSVLVDFGYCADDATKAAARLVISSFDALDAAAVHRLSRSAVESG
ncbi:HAD family hydrolase [Aureimonas populi]|uniref:Phosphoglycolate phosphatase n=1 Tax=Aureimonas populi TaxID=1701758 RepID=A0ABW5CG85_9HYPH|nr:HAD family hydrolase [Aureimonas populi]